jgi:multidrug resistance protein, MATE family
MTPQETDHVPEGRGPALVRLLQLAVPISASSLLAMALGLCDVIVVGQHDTAELAQLALAWALNGTLLVAILGLLVGVTVLVARAVGAGEDQAVGSIWRRGIVTGFWVGVGLGGLLYFGAETALGWMVQDDVLVAGAASCTRILALSIPLLALFVACSKTFDALNRPKLPMFVMIGANILNLGVNLTLVPHYGADGAAWATVITRAFTAIVILVLILRREDRARYGFLDRRRDQRDEVRKAEEAREQFSIGFSAMGSRLLEAGAFNAMTIFAGQVGTFSVATFSIFMNLLSFLFMPAMGIAAATSVLASNARGAGDVRGSLGMVWLGLGVAVAYAVLMGIVCLLVPAPIARAFTADPALMLAAAAIIAMVWLIGVFDFTQVVLAEALRALGANWFPAISHLGSYALVMAPLGWLLCVHFERGAAGLVEAIIAASVVSFCLLFVRFLFKRRQVLTAAAAG